MAERPPDGRGLARRPGRRAGLLAAVAVLAAGASVVLAVTLSGKHPAARAGTVRVATARVVRTDLVNTVQVGGSLGYAGSFGVVNQIQGTAYTALPRPGQVVRRGQRLYEVDGSPVVLFYGRRPQWRALSPGVTDGADVAQLDANLIALGYASAATLPVSDEFTAATAYAVEQWQAALGLPVTGTVPLGQLGYAPGPLRIATVTVTLGSTPVPGAAVLAGTSAQPVVSAALPVSQEYLVKKGDEVSVTLPDGTTTVPGTIRSVSRVATAASDNSSSGPPGGSSSGGGSGTATVTVIVALAHPRVAGHLDQAPVTIDITSAQASNVLAVPVNALVALAGGGYAVEVPQGSGQRLVGVRTGLFGAALVQVSGTGLDQGMTVQVPAS